MAPPPLHEELQAKLADFRKRRNFNVEDWIAKKVAMFNDYMRESGLKACVVSVSGGVDSAATLALCKRAEAQEGSPLKRVLGIAQPIHSTKSIQNRAFEVAEACGAEIVTVDQSDQHLRLCKLVEDALGLEGKAFARGQLRSYMRTPVNYYMCQLLSQEGFPACVMGTGNYDEDGYLFYFCKAGDGVVDVDLIGDLHKSEVFEVAAALGVPRSILEAPPSADLWDGQTDEDEMGFSYDFIYLLTEYHKLDEAAQESFKSSLSPAALAQFNELGAKAESIHRRNRHKANIPLNLNLLK